MNIYMCIQEQLLEMLLKLTVGNALNVAHETIPNQLGKPTETPTLRWVFQCFMAVHMVSLKGQQQIVNLTDIHRNILRFLGSASQGYYLLC